MDKGTLKLRYPYFVDRIEPKGRLLVDRKCHACFYYLTIAHNGRVGAGNGIEDQILVTEDGLETPLWNEKRYDQQARSVAMLYQLESPDEFLVFMPFALEEMKREGVEIQMDVLSPFGVGKTQ